jgi:hypothetical protein
MPAHARTGRPIRYVGMAAALALSAVSWGCSDSTPTTATMEAAPGSLGTALSDGTSSASSVTEDGLAFAFGSPLGSEMELDGSTLATGLEPVVEVCRDLDCLQPVAVFTTSGNGSERVRLDSDGQYFIVHWRPSSSGAQPGESFQIRVRLEDRVLGSAPVQVVTPRGRAEAGITPVIYNQAFAIRFTIRDAGGGGDTDPNTLTRLVDASGATLSLPGFSLDIPAGALEAPVEITMTRVPDLDIAGSPFFPGTLVSLAPTGLSFATPATLVIAFDPASVPEGAGPETLSIARLNDDGSTTLVPTQVDLGLGQASATIDGFSTYGFLGDVGTLRCPASDAVWVGGSITNLLSWHVRENWRNGVEPTPSSRVCIPASASFNPRIDRAVEVRDLFIESGSELALAGAGILVSGNLTAGGRITGMGSVLMESAGVQTARGTVSNLWISEGVTRLAGGLLVTGDLQVNGPGASLEIGRETLLVEGNLETDGATGRLFMDRPSGRVVVLGNARFAGGWAEGEPPLQAGVLEVHGNLRQDTRPDALRATGSHLTVLAAEGTEQQIFFGDPGASGSFLADVETRNPGQITFTTNARIARLFWGDRAAVGLTGRVVVRPGSFLETEDLDLRGTFQADELRISGELGAVGGTSYLVDRTVFTGTGQRIPDLDYLDLVVEGADVVVGAPWVQVRRSLILNDGELRIGGRILQTGIIRAEPGTPGGIFTMEDGDQVLARTVILEGVRQFFQGGTLWIEGDLAGRETPVATGVNHRTVFHGTETQTISGAGGFALGQVVLANTGDGVRIRTSALQLSGADASDRILDLVGNTRVEQGGNDRVSVGVAVFRGSSVTRFASEFAFNCYTAYTEPGALILREPEATEIGCARFSANPGSSAPELADFTPPSRLEVTILEPTPRSNFDEGQPITFRASATLGGSAVPATFRWSSSRDGNLGDGATLTRSDLRPGIHLIEVQVDATPSGGAPLQGWATVLITVGDEEDLVPRISSLELNSDSETLPEDESYGFIARALDQFGNVIPDVTFTWTSSNACIASVDGNGLATAHSPGTAIITVSAGEVSAQATVLVGEVDPSLPTSLLGNWRACRRSNGQFLFRMEVTEETGTTLRGRVFYPNGTSSIMTGSGTPSAFTMSWSLLVQGGSRTFGITDGRAVASHHLTGRYNDRFVFQTYDVELRRTPGPTN